MELHRGERQLADVVHRRAGAEVLEREADAEARDRGDRVGVRDALRAELERERGRRQVGATQDGLDVVEEARVGQLAPGDVDVDRERLHPCEAEMPRAQLARGRIEDAFADRHDEPALLGERQIVTGRDRPEQGMAPPEEGLDRGDRAGREVDDGLVLQPELVARDSAFEFGREIEGRSLRPRTWGHARTVASAPIDCP